MALFEGAGVALVTPFKENGEVNYEKLEEIMGEQITEGTNTIITCGTTGEASTMIHGKHLGVIKYICRATKKRIPVVAGTGPNCAEIAVYPPAEAEKRGAGGLLLVSPYYNKATQKGLMAHFTAAADAVEIPVTLYNIPSRTGATIKPEAVAALCGDADSIVGVKETNGNPSATATLMSLSDGKVDLYSGNDDQIVPLLPLGDEGTISALSSTVPRQTHDICASCFAGDVKTSTALQLKAIPLTTELFSEVNPIPVEAAMSMIGREVGPLHVPLTEVEPQNQEKFKKAMTVHGVLWEGFRKGVVYQW